MHPFAALAALPRHLRQNVVRDLAWVLLSPPLLAQAPWRQRHPLSASAWAAEPARLMAWLEQQDAAPTELEHWLSQGSSRRLGLYYERLWQFALARAPGIRLLGANLPVRVAGQTLGELDLLLQDEEGVHHLELAIKLYLGPRHGQGEDAAQWLGPGSLDRLDLKLEHLAQHQLPLSSNPECRPLLEELGAWPASAELWLGGYLFYPWPGDCTAPWAPTASTCMDAGCGAATSPTFSLRTPRLPGNPWSAIPGWRPRCANLRTSGLASGWSTGCWNSPQTLPHACWYAWRMRGNDGKSGSGCSWSAIVGRRRWEAESWKLEGRQHVGRVQPGSYSRAELAPTASEPGLHPWERIYSR